MQARDRAFVMVLEVSQDAPAFSAVRAIRHAVFVGEQGVPPHREFDATDTRAIHLLAILDDEPVGTARVYGEGEDARVGRVAVLQPFRRRGVGRALMHEALRVAGDRGYCAAVLHSQCRVAAFYETLGFEPEGGAFLEEGILHVAMRRILRP